MTAGKWLGLAAVLFLVNAAMMPIAVSDSKPGEGWAFLFFLGFCAVVFAWKMFMLNFKAEIQGRAMAREFRR